jgi:Ca2+-binding EF-hand superfamily protein
MTRRLPSLAFLLLVSRPPTTAAPNVPTPAPPLMGTRAPVASTVDHLDFVFLASDRPVLLRLHLQSGGRPYYATWDDYMKQFFTFIDRNGDGVLTREEAERVPNGQFLQSHLQGRLGFPYLGQTARLPDMDANKDGKVDPLEFANYYRKNFGPLRFSTSSSKRRIDGVTDTIYRHLDTDKDGKLSAEELSRATSLMDRLDFDEDEMLTEAELLTSPSDTRATSPAPRPVTRKDPGEEAGFLEIKPGERNEGIARQILSYYDRNRDRKLSRAESGLNSPLFDQLDGNHNGQLEASELSRFWQRDADLELLADAGPLKQQDGLFGLAVRGIGKRLGVPAAQPKRADLFNPSRRPMPLGEKVENADPQTLRCALGDARFQLFAFDQVMSRFRNLRQFYVRQFELADASKKGVVDAKQAQAVDFLKEIFVLADRDGDGKLSRAELLAYLDLQDKGSSCQTVLALTVEGRNLFEVLDANQDGRLSVRELRTVWPRLQPFAHGGGGLARGDVPLRLQLSVGQGQQGFRVAATVRPTDSAPPWFAKMDRNRDGDISRREFLGGEEVFRKLDADGDGLITVGEARLYEAHLKSKNLKP